MNVTDHACIVVSVPAVDAMVLLRDESWRRDQTTKVQLLEEERAAGGGVQHEKREVGVSLTCFESQSQSSAHSANQSRRRISHHVEEEDAPKSFINLNYVHFLCHRFIETSSGTN